MTLVEDVTGGDPQSGAKFVRRSLATLSRELLALGHPADPATVAKLLGEEDFALRVNAKRFPGPPHPDLLVELLALVARGELGLVDLTTRVLPAELDAAHRSLLRGTAPPCSILTPS